MAAVDGTLAPAVQLDEMKTPTVDVAGDDAPIKRISGPQLKALGQNLTKLFEQYRSDRRIQELRWLRNLRQYLGYYDPEVEEFLTKDRSRAYPKITRVKCISVLSRVMDLMFPSDDTNWTLEARPSTEMSIQDVKDAVAAAVAKDTDPANPGNGPQVDDDYVKAAVQDLAQQRAKELRDLISDQLQELGGDQTYDYVALNKEVVASGVLYGVGGLAGPFAREVKTSTWKWDDKTQAPVAQTKTRYMPQFEFVRCWDHYPDMSAKRLEDGDGYFLRRVMSKRQVRKLADREDFFGDVIKKYLSGKSQGNYKAQEFETELRTMGVKANVNEQKAETAKYEVLSWHGPVDGTYLRDAGIDVPKDKLSDQIDAEVWLLDGFVIKAMMNPWDAWGHDVNTYHPFVFDQDDTSAVGFGLPNIMRDTQMAISAATRMMLDNASVICGPILEVNTTLLATDQDLTKLHAYKIFYRTDDGISTANPAVRAVEVESHIDELTKIIDLFMRFGDQETFVGAATGGDMSKLPSEPMRNAAGASMLLGNAALPFKDIIRNFDRFTMSVIQSLVAFNRQLNDSPVADYDVIARGATSLIAKEVRGMQLDALAQSLTPEERAYVDEAAFVKARFEVRDAGNLLLSERAAKRNKAAADASAGAAADLQKRTGEAELRKILGDAFKAVTQGQKNSAAANATQVEQALDILSQHLDGSQKAADIMNTHAQTAGLLSGPTGGQDGGADADPTQ